MVFVTSVQFISPTETTAAVIEDPTPITPNNEDVELTKKIVASNSSQFEFYNTYTEETFSVIIEVTNTAAEILYNFSLTSPEINVTEMREIIGASVYEEEWFNILGNGSQFLGDINPGQSKSVSYTIGFAEDHYDTITQIEYFTFSASNITYQWSNGSEYVSHSNDIEFRVFEFAPTVRVQKFFEIAGVNSIDGRQAFILHEEIVNVTVKIVIKNFIPYDINLTGIDADSSADFTFENSSILEFNTTLLRPNQEFSYSYEMTPLDNGTFTLDTCEISVTYLGNGTVKEFTSNSPTIELYVPLYDGDDWTLKVPLLSVQKFFVVIEENLDGELIERYYSKLEIFNTTNEPIRIMINVTNTGSIVAYNITIEETAFNDWVFETDYLDIWTIEELAQGDNITIYYTITPIILGSFKFDQTKVTYSYQNQLTLLYETDQIVYSSIIELTIVFDVPEIDLSTQWWIAIGISFGVVLFAAIPLTIAFFTYKTKRKTQKGM